MCFQIHQILSNYRPLKITIQSVKDIKFFQLNAKITFPREIS